MPPHFRVIELRHRPRYPTQVEAHTVFHRRHIHFFCHLDVYMHYLAGDVNFLFRWVFLHRRSPRFNALGGHFPLASFLGERLRIVGSWTWPATKVPFWSYSPTTLRLPSHYSVIRRRESESDSRQFHPTPMPDHSGPWRSSNLMSQPKVTHAGSLILSEES